MNQRCSKFSFWNKQQTVLLQICFDSPGRTQQLCHFEVLSARPRQGTCSQQADEPVDKEMEQFMTRRRMFFGQQAINVI
jgi:hypothetical protein